MKIVDIRQRSPEWHAWRKLGVSATSAAVIKGVNPDKTEWRLWMELTGRITPTDLSMIPQVRLAIMLESHAMAWFEEWSGEIALPVCAESSEHPVIRASFDGLLEDLSPVEAKILADGNFEDVRDLQEESFHYRLYWWQVQHQMYVSGGKRGFLLFYHTRHQPIVFEIFRDDKAIAELVAAELAFWAKVVKDIEPQKCLLRDYFMPEGAGMVRWTSTAARMRHLDEERLKLEAQMAQIALEQEECKSAFLEMMGDHWLADCEGVRVTRYKQAGKVSWKGVAKQLDPNFSEARYPQHIGKPTERVKITVGGDSAMSEAMLAHGLGVVDHDQGLDFCV
ncbi:YqaJ viral recombinase family protein [Pseudomonas aeruginosa]|uniref:YqaJ viral recombinase family nuclease n=1 Tax=Pseudomonas aeruginosa TaxID=287 RepID=UPI00104B4836|nr:YqaJ viral recombinase family protein [Pseudomonas aeruginosa]